MQCREIYNLIFTSADWRCQREKWIIWGMEKCHWRAFFSVVQRRWSKTSKEATWTYEFEHHPTAHTYLHSCAHSWPQTLNYHIHTCTICTVHTWQFVSLRCLLVAPRWGTDACKQNFLVRVPDPLAQGNFCHFFCSKNLRKSCCTIWKECKNMSSNDSNLSNARSRRWCWWRVDVS